MRKRYRVGFEMKSSYEFDVTANNKAEAKAKAFKRFEGKRNKRKNYYVYCEEI